MTKSQKHLIRTKNQERKPPIWDEQEVLPVKVTNQPSQPIRTGRPALLLLFLLLLLTNYYNEDKQFSEKLHCYQYVSSLTQPGSRPFRRDRNESRSKQRPNFAKVHRGQSKT